MIVTGRREERLKAICERQTGMKYYVMDVSDPDSIRSTTRKAIAEFPALNCVINNAGIQKHVNFGPTSVLDDAALQAELATNVLGPIRVTAAFLPHLVKQRGATVINVSSGLAFVPMARFPVYCATKAAVHSWTMSLRYQLRHSGVKVIEIIPPWVATELGGAGKAPPPAASGRGPMALEPFIQETMKELETDADEVAVAEAKRLVDAACPETVRKVFAFMNG